MQTIQIGWSLLDSNNNEIQHWSDASGQNLNLPDLIIMPNGNSIHGAKAGIIAPGYTLVPRWMTTNPTLAGLENGQTIAWDGTKIIVTQLYRNLAAADLKAYSANTRWTKETAGTTYSGVYGTFPVWTDPISQSKLTSMIELFRVVPSMNVSFKTQSGFITANANVFLDVALSVAMHIERCFDTEKDVDSKIDAGIYTTYGDIDTAFSW